ncbi:MAG: hypothetical protein IID13_10380 [Candidatus Marinimicrobia bacterium]|nr:hypothetical protein [Candidatus Neomarinimicrobiota bacterium]
MKQAPGHSNLTVRYLKCPSDYLQQVSGESFTPCQADQHWADLCEVQPVFQT